MAIEVDAIDLFEDDRVDEKALYVLHRLAVPK